MAGWLYAGVAGANGLYALWIFCWRPTLRAAREGGEQS